MAESGRKFGIQEQGVLRKAVYSQISLLLETQGHKPLEISEGLLLRLEDADLVVNVKVKKERVDIEAEREILEEKERKVKERAAKKAAKIAKAKAKAKKEERKEG